MPRKPIDYSKTIIYKIVCNDTNIEDLYVGSTSDFTRRKCNHKNACINPQNASYNLKIYKIIRDNGGWINWSMIEIEKYPCNDNNEAHARERYWFEILKASLNSYKPIIYQDEIKEYSKQYYKEYYELNKDKFKEYYENNEDKIKEYSKEYYELNKDNVKEKKKEYYELNKDKITIYNKEYYELNKDKITIHNKEYYELNKDKIAMHNKEYYQQKKKIINTIERHLLKNL
jgi:hypothetical protein